jgi:hypothetical protein
VYLLHRPVLTFGESGAEGLVAPHDLLQGHSESTRIHWTRKPHRHRQVVDRGIRSETVEKPEPLLGEGERCRPFGRALDRRRRGQRLQAGPAAQTRLDVSGEARHGRRLEQQREWPLQAERDAQPRQQPGTEQRVATEVEKVVMAADPLAP